MRIAVFVGMFPCLSETFILDEVTGLLDLGHDVRIIAVTDSGNEIQQASISGRDLVGRTLYLKEAGGTRSANALACLKNISKVALKRHFYAVPIVRRCWPLTTRNRGFAKLLAILDHDFDVVHCHFGPNGAEAVEARWILSRNYPVLTSFHGNDMNPADGTARYSQLFGLGDNFIANTNYTRECLGQLGCPEGKISILPVGLNFGSSLVVPTESRAADRQLKLVTVARLVPFKGIGIVIRAVRKLQDEGLGVQFTVIGDGPLRDELQHLIERLGLNDSVTLAGPKTREHVFAAFEASDIFILPSIEYEGRTETQGLVLQEAQAAGLPVIASRIGGIPEGLSERNQQFLFTAGSVEELAERVKLVAQLRGEWTDIAAQGQQFVRQNYDNSVLVERLEAIYLKCIAGRSQSKR